MRQELLARLVESGPATATELAVELPVTRQAVAKQLAVLSRSGLVSRERHGRDVRFTAQPDALARTASWLERLAADWHDRLAAIKQIGATPE